MLSQAKHLHALKEKLLSLFTRMHILVFTLLVTLVAGYFLWGYSVQYEDNLLHDLEQTVNAQMSESLTVLTSAVEGRFVLLEGLIAYVHSHLMDSKNAAAEQGLFRFAQSIYAQVEGIEYIVLAAPGKYHFFYPQEYITEYDFFGEIDSSVRDMILLAIHRKEALITGPHQLETGNLGLVARKAVYHEEEFWGLVSMAVELSTVMRDAGLEGETAGVELAIRDQDGRVFGGNPGLFEQAMVTKIIPLPGGSWEVAAKPYAGELRRVSKAVLMVRGSLFLALFMFSGMFYLLTTEGKRMQFLVEKRTQELRSSNEELEAALEEIRAADEEIRENYAELQESEGRFRHLFDAASEAIFLLHKGKIVDCNQMALNMLGANRREEITGVNPERFFPTKQPDGDFSAIATREKVKGALQGETQLYYWKHLRLDGSLFDSEVSLSRLDYRGEVYLLAMVRDITERRQAEESLRASEERYREILATMEEGYYEVDLQGTITFCNNAAAALLGYTAEELTGMNFIKLYKDPETVFRAFNEVFRSKEADKSFTLEMVRKDGGISFGELSVTLVKDKTGRITGFKGIGRDVTGRMLSQKALRESEEQFRLLAENFPEGIIVLYDQGLRYILVEGKGLAEVGLSKEMLLGKKVSEVFPPDFCAALEPHIQNAFRGQESTFEIEWNGQFFKEMVLPFGINNDGVEAVMGVIKNITESKLAELALKESEQRLADVVNFLPDATFAIDLEGKVIVWNRAMEEMTGVKAGDILGKGNYEYALPFYGVRQPILIDLVLEYDQETAQSYSYIQQTADNSLISENFCPNIGEEGLYIWAKATPLYNIDGSITGVIESLRDVSAYKRLEDSLQYQLDLEKIIADISADFINLPLQEIDQGIDHTLKLIGEFAGIDRSHVFLFNPAEKTVSNTHEWHKEELESQEGLLQSVSLHKWPYLYEKLLQFEPVYLPRLAHLPAEACQEKEFFEDLAIQSTVLVPLVYRDMLKGFLSFSTTSKEKIWADEHLALLKIVGEVITNALERKIAEERISYLAYHDALTGLPNRLLFQDRLAQALIQAQRQDQLLAVLFIDLDHFKIINDTMGHARGDILLKEVAARLVATMRKSDTIGHFGGDEFVILAQNIARLEDTVQIVQKINEAFQTPFHIDEHEIFVTTSTGISVYPEDGEEAGTLLRNADIAMYSAKEQGRNNYQFCSGELKTRATQKLQLKNSLHRALERGEFILYYQPQVNLASGKISGLEALLRWDKPGHGLVSPGDFIPLAEDTGLIVPIGEWVLRTACAQCKNWQELGFTQLRMAVNLSMRQFQQNGLVSVVSKILQETSLPSTSLELEITENIAMKDPLYVIKVLNYFREMGITVSMDDFGTEYSSLQYLKKLPLDRLKIARPFVQGIYKDPKDAAIVQTIIVLARSMGLQIVAEGVETEEQLALLQLCDEIQGFIYYRPMPAEQIEKILRLNK